MKIQQNTNFTTNSKNQSPSQKSFTGAEVLATQFLRFLETNQAWGATAVDVGCMGLPRTAVDFTRGADAGVETARREFSSTINNSLVGAYGLASAWAISNLFGINNKFGVKAHQMLFDGDTLDIMSNAWKDKKGNVKEYVNDIVQNTKGFNPDHEKNVQGWVEIDKHTRENFVKRLTKDISETDKKKIAETKDYLKSLILENTGAENKFKLEKHDLKTVSSLDDYIGNIYKSVKSFKQVNLADNVFVKSLKSLNTKTAVVGLAIAGLVGVSLQPVNMFLTRKLTGKTGFVGVEGREADNSKGFKNLKTFAAVSGAALALLSISRSPAEILRKVQFKGLIPQLDQFKFVYGMTIASRLLSARDKNELRETSIKDSLGFVNWIILGGFVSKLTALGFEKMSMFKDKGEKFIRYEGDNSKTGLRKAFDWIQHSSVVTRDEVLHSALKKAGKPTIEGNKAMSFKRMMEEAKKVAPEAVKKVRCLGAVQLAGYAYSGIVLGMGIPKLNIAITRHFDKKHKNNSKEINSK